MQTHRARARQAIFVFGLLLLIIAAALINASITSGQGPPNNVYLPIVLHGRTCEVYPRIEIVFLEDPGLYYKVTPSDPTGYCPVMVFYRKYYTDQNGNSQWGPITSIQLDVWIWVSRYFDGETRHLLQFTGVNYTVELLP